jgi:hypothetical protein
MLLRNGYQRLLAKGLRPEFRLANREAVRDYSPGL